MIKLKKILELIIYWSIIIMPFSMAISAAPMNVFTGLFIVGFLLKKVIYKEKLFTKGPLDLPFLLFFIISGISIFNSINYPDSIKGLFKVARYILLVLIIAEEIKDEKQVKRIMFSIAAGISLTAIDCLWQIFSGKDFIRGYATIINLDLKRATASFVDANVLGVYLSALVPLVIAVALYYFKSKKRIIFSVISLLGMVAIALTYSRPTLLALYIVLFFLCIMKRDKVLIIILLVFTALSPFIAPPTVKYWAKQVNYNPLRFMCNDDRIAIYRNSFNMIKHHPVIGVGTNTFMKNYKIYKEVPEYRNIVTADYVYAHNNFFHMFAENGVIGLGIFLWLLYGLFRKSFSIYKKLKNDYLKIISLSLIACLIAFLVNGLTESSLYYSRVASIFWYLAGFSLALDKFTHAKNRAG
jgi:putative inorganic carbon (HCO3(-)) transporter